MKKILFVCTGNTCRSSMAEAMLKKLLQEQGIKDVMVSSAGTAVFYSSGASQNSIEVMNGRGIDLSSHCSRQVDKEMIDEASLILTMTVQHRENVIRLCPNAADKVFTFKEFIYSNEQQLDFDIIDPYGGSKSHYEQCFHEIFGLLEQLIEKLKKDYDEWKF